MARSTYIYAVMHPAQIPPLATFTVKHELKSMLERLENESPSVLRGLTVFRMADGSGGFVGTMEVAEVLGRAPKGASRARRPRSAVSSSAGGD